MAYLYDYGMRFYEGARFTAYNYNLMPYEDKLTWALEEYKKGVLTKDQLFEQKFDKFSIVEYVVLFKKLTALQTLVEIDSMCLNYSPYKWGCILHFYIDLLLDNHSHDPKLLEFITKNITDINIKHSSLPGGPTPIEYALEKIVKGKHVDSLWKVVEAINDTGAVTGNSFAYFKDKYLAKDLEGCDGIYRLEAFAKYASLLKAPCLLTTNEFNTCIKPALPLFQKVGMQHNALGPAFIAGMMSVVEKSEKTNTDEAFNIGRAFFLFGNYSQLFVKEGNCKSCFGVNELSQIAFIIEKHATEQEKLILKECLRLWKLV